MEMVGVVEQQEVYCSRKPNVRNTQTEDQLQSEVKGIVSRVQLPNEVGLITSNAKYFLQQAWEVKIVQGGLPGDGTRAIPWVGQCTVHGQVLSTFYLRQSGMVIIELRPVRPGHG